MCVTRGSGFQNAEATDPLWKLYSALVKEKHVLIWQWCKVSSRLNLSLASKPSSNRDLCLSFKNLLRNLNCFMNYFVQWRHQGFVTQQWPESRPHWVTKTQNIKPVFTDFKGFEGHQLFMSLNSKHLHAFMWKSPKYHNSHFMLQWTIFLECQMLLHLILTHFEGWELIGRVCDWQNNFKDLDAAFHTCARPRSHCSGVIVPQMTVRKHETRKVTR